MRRRDHPGGRPENDQEWTWPTRRGARLIAVGVRDRPGLLSRWNVELGWAGTSFRDPDHTLVSLLSPGADGYPRQYLWRIPEDGTPSEVRAAAALDRLASADPRAYGA